MGEATVFVSWLLNTPIDTLFDALANFLEQKGLREEHTFFWVCDYVIRQTEVKKDLEWLGHCVSLVGHTVLLMEPWHAPDPLKRAYCIKEVYYTQKSGAQFDVVMSTEQQAAFEAALVDDFFSIDTSLSKVNVRNATCRKQEETDAILVELEQDVGFVACNTLVIGLLRDALVAQAWVALKRLPAAERGSSALLSNLGWLLKNMGQLKEARPLLDESLRSRRETLGNHHPDTLTSINNMGKLLKAMGQLEEAKPLCEECMQAQRETLGDRHPETLASIHNMSGLLKDMGQLEEARLLLEEALQAQSETLGNRHRSTLISTGNMGLLLMDMGQLSSARLLLQKANRGCRETLGDRHPDTLRSVNNVGSLLLAMNQHEKAKPLFDEALQAQRETLGNRHRDTLTSIGNMGLLLQKMGQLEKARPLLEEAVRVTRETLGDRHPHTLVYMKNLDVLLKAMGG